MKYQDNGNTQNYKGGKPLLYSIFSAQKKEAVFSQWIGGDLNTLPTAAIHPLAEPHLDMAHHVLPLSSPIIWYVWNQVNGFLN